MFSPALSGATRTPRGGTPQERFEERRKHRQQQIHEENVRTLAKTHSWNDEFDDAERLPLVQRSLSEGKSSLSTWASALNCSHYTNALLYGIINSVLTVPCMYGYAVIIFSHQDFNAYMPALSKLVMWSSAVHQIVFTIMSSLPFAIGQVQDAGLIFLSAISASICRSLGQDTPLDAKITTTVVFIGLATASLGICLVLLGKFKLAGLVSYLPMPVVGGYLAYIGLFCLYAGFSLCTGLVINDFTSFLQVFQSHELVLCLPGLLGGILLLLVSQRCEHWLALPGCILAMPLLFYALLPLTGSSMEDARDFGWVAPSTDPATLSDMFSLFDLNKIHWSELPRQLPTWAGMVFVVAFSSCLDVAAIEMDMGQSLDINHELSSVGWSNCISGLLGGYTGSYIFSQTIFTFRSHVNSRIVGLCVFVSELALVVLPISVMSLVPRFFFAATLIFIAVDLMVEWLFLVYAKLLLREYVVLWLSFLAINWVSLELGMILGIGFAILNFLLGYASVRVVTRRNRRSAAVRKYASRTVLASKRDAIVYLELQGYLFFGSSLQILEDVQHSVLVPKTSSSPSVYAPLQHRVSIGNKSPLTPNAPVQVPVEYLDGTQPAEAFGTPTEHVVMDFHRVTGMDATAARSALMILQQQYKQHNIRLVYADVLPEIQSLLLRNDIADPESFQPNADAALELCENQVIAASSVFGGARQAQSHESMSVLLHRFMGEPDTSDTFDGIDEYFTTETVDAGHDFYGVADESSAFYFLASGRVALLVNQDGSAAANKSLKLLEHVLPGAMFGEVDFFGRQLRQLAAQAQAHCVVFRMSLEDYERLEHDAPTLWNRLRDVVMQSMALAVANTTTLS